MLTILFEAIEQQEKPRYVQFYSTDWTLTKGQIEGYERRGYKVVYEYIDDLNPHLAGTDELPVNVREKYREDHEGERLDRGCNSRCTAKGCPVEKEGILIWCFLVTVWIITISIMKLIRTLSLKKNLQRFLKRDSR